MLGWLLIYPGIITHLQVEAPESSQSTMEDELTRSIFIPPSTSPRPNLEFYECVHVVGAMSQECEVNGEDGKEKLHANVSFINRKTVM